MSKHFVPKALLAVLLALFAFNSQPALSEEKTTIASTTTSSLVTESTTSSATTSLPLAETTEDTSSVAVTEAGVATEGQSVAVRILSTTDLHTNLVNYDYYQDKETQNLGLAKTAVLIAKAKAENPNVVLVDNGDTIQGTPLGTYKAIVDPIEAGEQHPMYQALNSLGYDAGTLGNHEFNYGLDFLNKVISSAGLPLVNANVLNAQTNQPIPNFKLKLATHKKFTRRLVVQAFFRVIINPIFDKSDFFQSRFLGSFW